MQEHRNYKYKGKVVKSVSPTKHKISKSKVECRKQKASLHQLRWHQVTHKANCQTASNLSLKIQKLPLSLPHQTAYTYLIQQTWKREKNIYILICKAVCADLSLHFSLFQKMYI